MVLCVRVGVYAKRTGPVRDAPERNGHDAFGDGQTGFVRIGQEREVRLLSLQDHGKLLFLDLVRDGCVQLCPLRNKERLFVYQGLYLLPLPVVFGNPCQIFPAFVVEEFLTGLLFVSRGNPLLLFILVQLSARSLLSFVVDTACIVGVAVSVLSIEEILVFLVRKYRSQNVLEHLEVSVVLFMSGHLRFADRGSVSADVRIPVPGNDQNALQKGPAVKGAECFRNVIFLGFQNL